MTSQISVLSAPGTASPGGCARRGASSSTSCTEGSREDVAGALEPPEGADGTTGAVAPAAGTATPAAGRSPTEPDARFRLVPMARGPSPGRDVGLPASGASAGFLTPAASVAA